MRILTMSEEGRDWLAEFEGGYRLEAYLCPAGVWTISAGITAYSDNRNDRVRQGDRLSSVWAAKSLFKKRLKHFEAGVDSLTRDTLTQNQLDALCSFGFNCGIQALASSTLVRRVNNETDQPAEIQAEWEKWCHSNGKRSRGLFRRRRAEALCYLEGSYLSVDEVKTDDE